MSMLAQGTQVYFIDPNPEDGGPTVVEVACPTQFSSGGAPFTQVDVSCLNERDSSALPGRRQGGQATLTVNATPSEPSHIRLHQIYASDTGIDAVLKWAIGWPDGNSDPSLGSDGDDFNLPGDRTWYVFEGYVADFPFDHSQDSPISTAIQIQRSGGFAWVPKESEEE